MAQEPPGDEPQPIDRVEVTETPPDGWTCVAFSPHSLGVQATCGRPATRVATTRIRGLEILVALCDEHAQTVAESQIREN